MELTKNNFELYAAKHYQKDKWSTDDDFKEDMSRFKYINRLVNRYYRDDDLKERLILNHIIILGFEYTFKSVFSKVCPLKFNESFE